MLHDGDFDFTVERLGCCRHPSPLSGIRFTCDDERVLYHARLEKIKPWIANGADPPAMELAGPRSKLFFDPSHLTCGIVTCGGLCPVLNDVIRAVVFSLSYHYGVNRILGFRYGYEGLVQRIGHKPLELTLQAVSRIDEIGGTVLGSSRGPQDPVEMVKMLRDLGVGVLFTVGGDGTLRGAQKIAEEANRQGVILGVVAVPKTIDNDISFVQKTFGFETAVTEARRAVYAAHAEAEASRNGIGLVKLMGRDSGFIAAYSVLAESQANYCLVPEVPFTLDRFLHELSDRLCRRGHAVIVVAEGAGQDLMGTATERDISGNVKYGDIGVFLKDKINNYFSQKGLSISIKYIDPSYAIRSVPTNAHDAAFCMLLGHSAAHAAMAGRTNMVVGFWNHEFTHIPISVAISQRKRIDPEGTLWNSVLACTGQPAEMR